jgi:hypothetical protein
MTSFDRSDLVRDIAKISIVGGIWSWVGITNDVVWANTRTNALIQPQAVSASQLRKLNRTIVPGHRVGDITATTTYTDLVRIFGQNRLSAKTVADTEGHVEFVGTSIALGRNRSLTVAWKDRHRLQPLKVIINDPAWKTAEGIGLGMSLERLRQVLGEFKITGLYWDYGNQVVHLSPWNRSRYTGLSISVDADRVAAYRFPKELRAVTGDRVTLAASHPNWKPLKMHVSGLVLYFSRNLPSKPQKSA